MEFHRKTVQPQAYLYVDCECRMEGPEIAKAMGDGFGTVFGFLGQAGIAPISMPITVYHEMPNDRMRFQCGAMVAAADAAGAVDPVKAGEIPGGDVMTTTHVGPYDRLNQTHGALWNHMKTEGIPGGMPVWEIYIDDPDETDAANLRTEIFRMIDG